MQVVQRCLEALADGDEVKALSFINEAPPEALAWACATFMVQLQDCIAERAGRKPHRVAMALRAGARGMDEDLVMTQVRLILDQADRTG